MRARTTGDTVHPSCPDGVNVPVWRPAEMSIIEAEKISRHHELLLPTGSRQAIPGSRQNAQAWQSSFSGDMGVFSFRITDLVTACQKLQKAGASECALTGIHYKSERPPSAGLPTTRNRPVFVKRATLQFQ
jgi:hypothetical protein